MKQINLQRLVVTLMGLLTVLVVMDDSHAVEVSDWKVNFPASYDRFMEDSETFDRTARRCAAANQLVANIIDSEGIDAPEDFMKAKNSTVMWVSLIGIRHRMPLADAATFVQPYLDELVHYYDVRLIGRLWLTDYTGLCDGLTNAAIERIEEPDSRGGAT